ncbi:transient receptor potential cation channel trpm isoform X3 [Cryptotermes secundus]|uniref:transient receptor potential cation channel trpm isoform X3 n=1 Tax=Cryptotermes secundus TaxID=105785 RepID=UPI000CD7B9F9|nr:transient receptor potential cation channel trpm isoform X3 [Cryptotermes secundus]
MSSGVGNGCYCNRPLSLHCGGLDDADSNRTVEEELWMPSTHTQLLPTDAFGTIEFQSGTHKRKAQYVRLAHDTRPELIMQLFTKEWGLELPKLVITVEGGKSNFGQQRKLGRVLHKSLSKIAGATGAWVFTDGLNKGVTRQIGDALLLENVKSSAQVIVIGIAPWGIVEDCYQLCGHNHDVPYHSISSLRPEYAVLNKHHSYFLLADDGTLRRYGAELVLRRNLEKYISNQKLHPGSQCCTPLVCLMIGGGCNTIRTVRDYVMDTPLVPVVVCDGSGRAADLLASVLEHEQTVLESMRNYFVTLIQNMFEVDMKQAECLYSLLLQCTQRKNLITVVRLTDQQEETSQELDLAILKSVLTGQHLSSSEQFDFALMWNRVDIATSDIFICQQEWPPGALEEAMMQALKLDRVDFVKLLLKNGVSMQKFLSVPRLEELYNTKQGPFKKLGYISRQIHHISRGNMCTLHDVGLLINKLMGGSYKSYYTQRKFQLIYARAMRKSLDFQQSYGTTSMTSGLPRGTLLTSNEENLFDYPFNELLVWAVLTERQQMALLMWQNGEEALAKALVACKLYNAMADEVAENHSETQIYEDLINYRKEFENIALELLDYCYKQRVDQAKQLLTCELQNWSKETCLNLAVAANHLALLAHPCSQMVLADLWRGGLCTRKSNNLKVIFGLLCPFYIPKLEFKLEEELQLLPQAEEEHLVYLEKEHKSTEGQSTDNHHNTVADAESLIYNESHNTRNANRNNRPLSLGEKLYAFYTAPITKYWGHSIAYIVFLMTFSYTVLVKMENKPSWPELYTIIYICTLACEEVREILSSKPVALRQKLSVWAQHWWNPCEAVAIIFFFIGLFLRLHPSSLHDGRLIFCVNIVFWFVRILKILAVNKYFGLLVTMMGKMLLDTNKFMFIIIVILLSFATCHRSILHPNREPSWAFIREMFFKPYFMLFGEVFAESILPECDKDTDFMTCQIGRWFSFVQTVIYLFVSNFIIINVLLALYNNRFDEVSAVSRQVWMFRRFRVVMEYEKKPVLPPPLTVFCHVFLLFRHFHHKVHGTEASYDNDLKLFLDHDVQVCLGDFEEECLDSYLEEQETKLHRSNDECIRNTADKVDNLYEKVKDISQERNNLTSDIQGIEVHIRKLGGLTNQMLSHSATIHRFMGTNVQEPLSISGLPDADWVVRE